MNELTRSLLSTENSHQVRRITSARYARQIVVDLIERVPKTPVGKRVERILELLLSAENCRSIIARDGLRGRLRNEVAEFGGDTQGFHSPQEGFQSALPSYRFADTAIEAANLRYKEMLRDLQAMLSQYRWAPTVEDRIYQSLVPRLMWDETVAEDAEENRAVQLLLDHIDGLNGRAKILRFRRCGECQGWFYALMDRQAYCSEAHRKRSFSHSAEFKKSRAEYMRTRYRPGEKERSQKPPEKARVLLSEPIKVKKGKR